jgi:hypothetical protein
MALLKEMEAHETGVSVPNRFGVCVDYAALSPAKCEAEMFANTPR